MMSKGVEELTISESNYLDSLIADRNFAVMERQLTSLKNQGRNVEKYEKRAKGVENAPMIRLTGDQLWRYLGDGHGYSHNQE